MAPTSSPEPDLIRIGRLRKLRESYSVGGYATPLHVLSPSEAAAALSDFDAWVSSLPNGKLEGDMRFKPHLHLPFVNRLVHHPAIVDAASTALDADDMLLWSSDFNVKDPGSGGYFAMHQDATYTGLEPAERGVTVWLALSDPVDEEHGCMTFVGGSHRRGQMKHVEEQDVAGVGDNMLSRGQRVGEDYKSYPECGGEVLAVLHGGEASLHHFHLLHKSGPNQGNERRVGLALRYIAASVQQTGQVRESVTLVKGRMVHDGFDLESILPLTGEVSDEAIRRGLKAHADAMRREAENYFEGSQASAYDQMKGN